MSTADVQADEENATFTEKMIATYRETGTATQAQLEEMETLLARLRRRIAVSKLTPAARRCYERLAAADGELSHEQLATKPGSNALPTLIAAGLVSGSASGRYMLSR